MLETKQKSRKGNESIVPRGLLGPDPSSVTGKALVALLSSRHLCPWEAREGALKSQPHDGHDLFGIP